MPARLGAASSFEGRKAAFDERTELGDLAQSGIASFGVPIRNFGGGLHGEAKRAELAGAGADGWPRFEWFLDFICNVSKKS